MSKQLNRRLPRFGNDPPHHHHHHHTDKCNHKHQPPFKMVDRRLLARFGVVIAVILVFCNFDSIVYSAGSSKKNGRINNNTSNNIKGRNKQLESLPIFPDITYPPIDDSDQARSKWDKWAEEPMVGSYTFISSKKNPHRPITTYLHLPIVDMENLIPHGAIKDKDSNTGLRVHNSNNNDNSVAGLLPKINDLTLASPDYVVLTRRGEKYSMDRMKRQANQDRVGLLSASADVDDGDNDWWIGLFDGHGTYGHSMAQYSILEFAKHMQDELTTVPSSSPSTSTTTTAEIQDRLKEVFLNIHRSMPHLDGSGCTGISIWKRGHQLYISNVGDSLAFVVRYNPKQLMATTTTKTSTENAFEIIYETKPHKPDSPNERKRIEGVGGQVEDPPLPGLSARIIIPSPDGVFAMALAMSRSLGDHDGEPYGLLAEPTTDVLDLTELKAPPNDGSKDSEVEYLVVACTDGLVDRVKPEEVARELAVAFSSGEAELPIRAAERLILKSSAIWVADTMDGGYRDDISIVVRRLALS